MKAKTYKLTKIDLNSVEPIQKILNLLLPTSEEAKESVRKDGKYIREFDLSDSGEIGFCLDWLEGFKTGSN